MCDAELDGWCGTEAERGLDVYCRRVGAWVIWSSWGDPAAEIAFLGAFFLFGAVFFAVGWRVLGGAISAFAEEQGWPDQEIAMRYLVRLMTLVGLATLAYAALAAVV